MEYGLFIRRERRKSRGEVMELESRILRVLLLMAKMEVMPLIMEVVEEEPLKLLVLGLRAV